MGLYLARPDVGVSDRVISITVRTLQQDDAVEGGVHGLVVGVAPVLFCIVDHPLTQAVRRVRPLRLVALTETVTVKLQLLLSHPQQLQTNGLIRKAVCRDFGDGGGKVLSSVKKKSTPCS